MAPSRWQRQHARAIDPIPSNSSETRGGFDWRSHASDKDLILESWSQGFVVGSILIMICITLANMRRHILLHKLIFLEQLMALTHGTFCFMNFSGYGWYLSSTAALLYLSLILHNAVAWMKVKPFFYGSGTIFTPGFVRWTTPIYIYSLICTVPVILFQITDNFRFFNGYGGWYSAVRPYEPLMRDPWWIFCSGILFYVISRSYGMNIRRIIKRSARFGILFVAITLSLIFTALDVAASITPFIGGTLGINPWWKLSLVCKLLTDTILLDDFKTELRRLGLKRVENDEKQRGGLTLTLEDDDFRYDSDDAAERSFSSPTTTRTYNGGRMDDRIRAYKLSAAPAHRKAASTAAGTSEEIEFMQALDDIRPSDIGSSRSGQQHGGRLQVGRGAIRATRLPSLFAAVRRSKRPKGDSEIDRKMVVRSDATPYGQHDLSSRPLKHDTSKINYDGDFALETSGSRGQNEHHTMSSSVLASRPAEFSVAENSIDQARMTNEATIQELRARKNKVTPSKNRKGQESVHPGEQTYHSSLTDMIRDSSQDPQNSSAELEDDTKVLTPAAAGPVRDKHRERREWWDQIEEDLEYLDRVNRVEDVETSPAVRQ